MTESQEEIETRHKKELKAFEGEKRAAIKKAKGTKGKKAKEALAELEADFVTKFQQLQDRHQKERSVETSPSEEQPPAESEVEQAAPTAVISVADTEDAIDDGLTDKERKQLKARQKKERKKQREAERQAELEAEAANAGPGLKEIEEGQIQAILSPLNMQIIDVTADGHCLYRAVAAQTGQSFSDMRSICANTLSENQDEFAPFCEYTDTIPDFDHYVGLVRNSAEWGGHLELRALGMGLKRTIEVYSVQAGNKPLVLEPQQDGGAPASDDKPIRLSYHLHYYALGEHYNQVVLT